MSHSNDHKDDDTTPIKPLALTGIVLLSAGAGLAAGLLICWLCCAGANGDDNEKRISQIIEPAIVNPG